MPDFAVWSSKSLIDYTAEPAYSANASRFAEFITLNNNGIWAYINEYDTAENSLKTSALLFSTYATSSSDLSSRYTRYLVIDVAIRYWEEDKDENGNVKKDENGNIIYVPGTWDEITLYPYFVDEPDRLGYIEDIEIPVKNKFIKTLRVSYDAYNLTQDTEYVQVVEPRVYPDLDFEQALNEYGGGGGSQIATRLKSIDTYTDGMIAYYADSQTATTLKVTEVEPNKKYNINVSGKYDFIITLNDGNMPDLNGGKT